MCSSTDLLMIAFQRIVSRNTKLTSIDIIDEYEKDVHKIIIHRVVPLVHVISISFIETLHVFDLIFLLYIVRVIVDY